MNLIIKGFIIGIGKIIPGVSGSMLAITLGVYEKIIESISNIKKNAKYNISFLTKIGIGIILSITLISKIIVKCLNQYYLPTMLLFVGMIIGGMPNIIKKTKLNTSIIIITIIILSILTLITSKINITTHYQIKYTLIDTIKLIGIGIVDALSSIIPGISGTALLMMLGYYDIILNTFANITNTNSITQNIFIITPFIFGFIIGTITISKLINIIIKKHHNTMNIIIIVFMTSTIIILLKNTLKTYHTLKQTTLGIPLLILGTTISLYLDKKQT